MNITDQAKKQLPPNWLNALDDELKKPYWLSLNEYLQQQDESAKIIYPPCEQIFSAFHHTDLESVKVVRIGKDH